MNSEELVNKNVKSQEKLSFNLFPDENLKAISNGRINDFFLNEKLSHTDDLFFVKDDPNIIKPALICSINSNRPETSPTKYNFANIGNLLISPIVENKKSSISITPNKGFFGGEFPQWTGTTPFEMKIHSPLQENIIHGLKHDEKSSSFKRIKINNYNDILQKNINFEGTGGTSDMNDVEYFSKKQEYFNKNFFGHAIGHGTSGIRLNQNYMNQRILNSYNGMNFSSDNSQDNDNNYDCENDNAYDEENKNSSSQISRKYLNYLNRSADYSSPKYSHSTNFIGKNFLPYKKICCTCTKSRCLKKYCECFSNNSYCDGCECRNCYNMPVSLDFSKLPNYNKKARESVNKDSSALKSNNYIIPSEENLNSLNDEKTEILCNCTKSNCMKKYCECFKAGEGCKDNCRCINCENDKKIQVGKKEDSSVNNIITEANKEKRQEARNPINFIIEGTSVYICNDDISITQRKETPLRDLKKIIMDDKIHHNERGIDFGKYPLISNCDREDNSQRKSIFQVNSIQDVLSKSSLQSANETPKLTTKKRRRNNNKEDSIVKSSSTLFQTQLFTTSSHKSSNRLKLDLDRDIVKNLDTIY